MHKFAVTMLTVKKLGMKAFRMKYF